MFESEAKRWRIASRRTALVKTRPPTAKAFGAPKYLITDLGGEFRVIDVCNALRMW